MDDEGFFDKELKKITSLMKSAVSSAIDQWHGEAAAYLQKNSAYVTKAEHCIAAEIDQHPMPSLIIAGTLGWIVTALLKRPHGTRTP